MNLRGAHLAAGLLAFAAFVITGQYMELAFAHLQGMPDAPRLMYRSAHIYLFYAAMLNLALAAYIAPLTGRSAMRLQLAGSIAILVAPLLLLVSFFAESRNHDPLSRPVAVAGIYLSLLGIALHLIAAMASRQHSRGATD